MLTRAEPPLRARAMLPDESVRVFTMSEHRSILASYAAGT